MQYEKEIAQAVSVARRGKELTCAGITRSYIDVSEIPGAQKLPRSLVVLLENVIRRAATDELAQAAAQKIIAAASSKEAGEEIEFMPARVLFQDFTGVPVFVDFAAMRDAMLQAGGDPSKVNPQIPCTLVIDHSVTADVAGCAIAEEENLRIEAQRNAERFAFLKWSQQSFDNVEVVPPGQGICHQLNIERFCKLVTTDSLEKDCELACFDSLVGTDSHTTTANGIGVLGWGVGGIEAEAAALGQPISMLVPEVVGLHLTGELSAGCSGMDLALRFAELLRAEGVVGCIVEVFGEGVSRLSATQRSCVSNMTPEYGATATFFCPDEAVMDYMRLTGRDEAEVAFAEAYLKAQGCFGETGAREYGRIIELDLSSVEPSLAGPSRPHDRLAPSELKERVRFASAEHGHADMAERVTLSCEGTEVALGHGTIAIAAITSCTTATDPAMMLAAGLVARKAEEAGLHPQPWVKRVLAPGSHATELLLERSGLLKNLNAMGFYTCGFGCMSCIGNSGEINDCLKEVTSQLELTSVLSGNRNFEGRINPDVAQNYLCQPALVVAYSLVGTMDVDLSSEPVGVSPDGTEVFLSDVMPTEDEIYAVMREVLDPSLYEEGFAGLIEGDESWRAIDVSQSETFSWDKSSTYVRRPPYFELAQQSPEFAVNAARVLALLGDFVTTDHISPAGTIAADSPAAYYLKNAGVELHEFNSYGSRRGNDEVMARGTFANVRLSNALAKGRLGGWTTNMLTGDLESIFDASVDYAQHDVELIVLAGKMYGSGSSRDWAAKGPFLLGVRAVIAESFERIHRSNLIGMGIVPLELCEGNTTESLGLDGSESFSVSSIDFEHYDPAQMSCTVTAVHPSGTEISFDCNVRVDTPTEAAYLCEGGILPYVLKQLNTQN